jgi:hypothetical protein
MFSHKVIGASRQKIKRAFKNAGAGTIRVRPRTYGYRVFFTCPQESDSRCYDDQRMTHKFKNDLYTQLRQAGATNIPLEEIYE